MRILGIGHEHDLADLYLALEGLGHEVRVFVADVACHDIFAGSRVRVTDWRAELEWVGHDGLVLFENADLGAEQDALRREGLRVVGGSAYGDRLETDRSYGQTLLADLGLDVAATYAFRDFAEAVRFVAAAGAQRFVLKPNGGASPPYQTYVGTRADGADIVSVLGLEARRWRGPERPDFVLMEHVEGVEVGVGAFFDGHDFLSPPNLDWEHRRFFPGDLGELTGEMGVVATYRGADKLFEATLGRLAPRLRARGHRGYVHLSMVVGGRGVVPIEITARFTYPGFAVLAPLQVTPWDELLIRIAAATDPRPARTATPC